jgi:3'-phosphoadenosine 5'-phosphosulfate synthase
MQQGCVVWLTGLSGAGKSTLARKLEARLDAESQPVEVLDGDIVRQNLSYGLGFSREDRDTNIRRIGFVADLLARNGVVAIVAAISPYRSTRDEVRASVHQFIEVFVKCDLDTLIERDPKGLYSKALRGEIQNFTGISDPYEEPVSPELTVETDRETEEESVQKILQALAERGVLVRERVAAVAGGDGHGEASPIASTRQIQVSPGASGNGASGDGYAPAVPQPSHSRTESIDQTISPHGGVLINRVASADEAAVWDARAEELPSVALNAFEISDLEMIAIGGFSPLTGFMGSRDYDRVIREMRLQSGLVWPIPITLGVREDEAAQLETGNPVALRDAGGTLLGILHLEEIYRGLPELEAKLVYKTGDTDHPGVKAVYERGQTLLGGPITLVQRTSPRFPRYQFDPADTRRSFSQRGWRRVVGFQTRNPVHRAHEYIQKAALETMDGLLLHPLVGETKSDDIPADIRMRCYEVLLEKYYPKDRVILAINPASMRYAGPREALLHALVRQNYGCTHFIVGRDHAGVGDYYGPFDAQLIFDEFQPGEIQITPLLFDHTFYCRECVGMASTKTCPHDRSHHVALSGTQVRSLLQQGQPIPTEFTRPEVSALLREAMEE